MKILNLFLALLMLFLVGMVALIEFTPNIGKEDGDLAFLIVIFIFPFIMVAGAFFLKRKK